MDIGALNFQNPEAFWLLILVPVLVGWYIYREHRRKSTIKFPALSIVSTVSSIIHYNKIAVEIKSTAVSKTSIFFILNDEIPSPVCKVKKR